MTVQEFNKIKHSLGYRDYCYYMQKKNGKPEVSYGTPGYLKDRYECHHIAEDEESNLCKKIQSHPHLQQPDMLVYLTPEEHLWAHLLISSEVLLKDTTSEKCEDLSKGGIGFVFNKHKDQMDMKLVAKMIAEYCNRISSQMVLEAGDSREAFSSFCHLYGIKDRELITSVEQLLTQNICFPHNREAYIQTKAMLMKEQSCITRICTCGGKTPFALEFMAEHYISKKKYLVVTASENIYNQWAYDQVDNDTKYKTHYRDLYDVATIQTLSKEGNFLKIDWNKYSMIISDEVHHINKDAKVWIKPFQHAKNLGLKILGLTATLAESQENAKDEIFEGRIIEGLDIVTGIQEGILWPYNYISSLYSTNGMADLAQYNLIQEPLDLFLKEHNVSQTIIKYENKLDRKGQKKGIIFVAGTRNIPEDQRNDKLAQFNQAIELVGEAYPNAKFYILSSKQSNKENCDNKNAFRNNTTDDCFLVSFGMVNEGSHYEGINTLIMFRTTHSEIVFTQQLGRIMRLKSKCPEDPKLTVFDFTNNALTLLDEVEKETSDVDLSNLTNLARKKRTTRPETYLEGKDVIVACEAADIVNYLLTLRVMKDQKKEGRLFSDVLDSMNISDINIDEVFENDVYDNWKDIDIISKGTTQIKRSQATITVRDGEVSQPDKKNNLEEPNRDIVLAKAPTQGKTATTADKIKLTKEELLIYLTKLTFDRAVLSGGIDFMDTKLQIIDETLVKDLCKIASLKLKNFIQLISADKLTKFWELRVKKIISDIFNK